MVKIKYGGGVAQMSGSEAGRTYARNKGGAYIRNRTTPLNPNSTFQQTVRARVNTLSKAWGGTLTNAQRDSWIAFSAANPITDVFGESLQLTGAQMYLRLNARLDEVGATLLTSPPANLVVTALDSLVLDGDIGMGDFDITYTPTPVPANHVLVVRMTAGLSPGIRYVTNRLRLVTFFAAATASPQDIETVWQTRYGALPSVGQRVVCFAHLINTTNGAVSVALRSDVLITTT